MIVSDFIELIARLINMSSTPLIIMMVLFIIMGAITKRVASGRKSSVTLITQPVLIALEGVLRSGQVQEGNEHTERTCGSEQDEGTGVGGVIDLCHLNN